MTTAVLDSASVLDIRATLSFDRVADAYPWAVQNAALVTNLLLFTSALEIPPSPGGAGSAAGEYAVLREGLPRLSLAYAQPRKVADATRKTKAWASQWPDSIRRPLDVLEGDAVNFQPWLDWVVTHAWQEHAARLKGLFNKEYLSQLAPIVGVSHEELRELHCKSENQALLGRYANGHRDDSFAPLCRAFVSSGLIRARFHEYASRPSRDVLHHPYRAGVLTKPSGPGTRFSTSSSQNWFTFMLLASAFSTPRRGGRRIAVYLDNMTRAHEKFGSGELALPGDPNRGQPMLTHDVAFDLAYGACKELGVTFNSSRLDEIAALAVGLGLATATSFVLHPWAAFSVGVGAVAVSQISKVSPLGRTLRTLPDTPKRIDRLAREVAGRIDPAWTNA